MTFTWDAENRLATFQQTAPSVNDSLHARVSWRRESSRGRDASRNTWLCDCERSLFGKTQRRATISAARKALERTTAGSILRRQITSPRTDVYAVAAFGGILLAMGIMLPGPWRFAALATGVMNLISARELRKHIRARDAKAA